MSEGFSGLGISAEAEVLLAVGVVAAIFAGWRLLNSPNNPTLRSWTDTIGDRSDRVGGRVTEAIDLLNRDPRRLPGQPD